MLLPRSFAAVCAAIVCSSPLFAQTPPPVLAAIREASAHLAEGHPHNAVETLERQLSAANGDRDFTAALRAAYVAELKGTLDPVLQDRVKAKLALLEAPAAEAKSTGPLPPPVFGPATTPVPTAAPEKPAGDWIKQATNAFNRAKSTEPSQFLNARDLFNLAFRNKVEMTPEQTAAWAYCRLKVAADKLNKSTDAATAADVSGEVEAALRQVPNHAALQEAGRDVLAVARPRAGNRTIPKVDAGAGSFLVKGSNDATFNEKLVLAAEAKRAEIFARWSGPPGGPWAPQCELAIHADGAAFERATQLPAGATGRADVKLRDGVALARRIDLRADDPNLFDDALPRELTTVILADLFASQAPPKWAELGMAVLASSDAEVGRYLRTLPRCDRDGDLPSIESLLKAIEIPAKGVTGFYVESVSLVDFLVRWQGEKTFTAFVRDSQRYGAESALKRQYGVKDFRQLEETWRANVFAARK